MDEVMSREFSAGGGVNKELEVLFSACLQVLPSNREETDRELESASPFISSCSQPCPPPQS